MTNTMFVRELLVNVGQHQWQHQAEEPTVPNEHYVTISSDLILSEMRNEWQKAVADIHKTLALVRLAVPMLVQYPGFSDVVVQTPAFVVGFVFQNTAIIFTERISDVIRPPKSAREDVCRFDGTAQRTGEDA
jgi:hypothetical protein